MPAVSGPQHTIASLTLYDCYADWCAAKGERAETLTTLMCELNSRSVGHHIPWNRLAPTCRPTRAWHRVWA